MSHLRLTSIPKNFPVRPLRRGQKAADPVTCGTCGLMWDDAKATRYTPAPAGRCPFEHFHTGHAGGKSRDLANVNAYEAAAEFYADHGKLPPRLSARVKRQIDIDGGTARGSSFMARVNSYRYARSMEGVEGHARGGPARSLDRDRQEIEEARQFMRENLHHFPQGHVIDVMNLPRLGKWVPHLVAVGADLSHDTVLLPYPKGQWRTFIVVRKGSVRVGSP